MPVGVDTNSTEFNIVEKTGGNNTHSHNYKLDNMKTKLVLEEVRATDLTGEGGGKISSLKEIETGLPLNTNDKLNGGAAWNYNESSKLESSGKTDTQSNIMEYITCYIFKRIS